MAKRSQQKSAAKAAARERAAAIQAAQEAQERRNRLIVVGATLGVIALVVIGLVIAALNRPEAKPAQATAPLSAPAKKALTSVPAKEFDAIGVGTSSNAPKKVKNGRLISTNGKPQILYVGAEYCPYCAGLRWSTAVAMSRFGTWGELSTTHSAPAPEVFPDTATLSFSQKNGTKLTSEYVDFVSYETATNQMKNGQFGKLDDLTGADLDTFKKLNAKPYVTQGEGAIPFISFGGKAIQAGGGFDTALLQGKTAEQIALALQNPKDPIAAAIIGNANELTAATCEATGGKPANVCTSPGVKAAAAKLETVG